MGSVGWDGRTASTGMGWNKNHTHADSLGWDERDGNHTHTEALGWDETDRNHTQSHGIG